MMRNISYRVLVALAMIALHSHAEAESQGEQLLTELKNGGYVIYLRHASSDTTKSDQDPVTFGDCATQRPLSASGRSLARDIGQAIKARAVRIARLLTSPYCRAEETAALAFPEIKAKAIAMLAYSLAMPK